MRWWTGIGVMSGSSLDGVDLALCRFGREQGAGWQFEIQEAETVGLGAEWLNRLQRIREWSAPELLEHHFAFGHFLGRAIRRFLSRRGKAVNWAGIHGPTLFHRPRQGFTFQLGAGEVIACHTDFPVVTDFRHQDVALGGQGAPLVPLCERLLFPGIPFLVNLGGIVNLTTAAAGFDVCVGNQALNELARAADSGLDCDREGRLARRGSVAPQLLEQLNALPWYRKSPPKALDREWYERELRPLLFEGRNSIEDCLATYVEHIADCVARSLRSKEELGASVMISGGGNRNRYLVERIEQRLAEQGIVLMNSRESDLDLYKEALIFAFLGLLNLLGTVNVDGQRTGSGIEHVGGSLHFPPRVSGELVRRERSESSGKRS